MSLLQMSISGTTMILLTVVVRALLLHRFPKRTFLVLWGVILLRLLVPYSLPCEFSVYSLLTQKVTTAETPQNVTVPLLHDFLTESVVDASVVSDNDSSLVMEVWLTGVLICFVFFAMSYVKCRIKFRESLPVDNEYIMQWLAEHRIFRRISVRCSDRISTPLTYGVFYPVILLPKDFKQLCNEELKFVLAHEYVHIRYFDAYLKFALIVALCIHWFNPMVWVMFIIANRDIEISCDEAVIKMLGDHEKQAYAMLLVCMEESKSGLAPLNNNFCKNAIKERIVAIMNFKKTTALAITAAACLIVGTTTVFATTVETKNNDSVQQASQSNESDETMMTVSSNSKTELNISPLPKASDAEKVLTTPVEAVENSIKEEMFSTESTITLEPGIGIPVPDGSYIIQEDTDENGNRIVRYSPIVGNPTSVMQNEEYSHEEIDEDGILRW